MTDMPPNVALPKDDRERYTYKVPETARRRATDPRTVTMVDVRLSDEEEADKVASAAGGGDLKFTNELIRRSVVEIDGKPVDWSAPGGPEWLERTSAPVRNLIKKAFARVHRSDKGDEDAFLASESVLTP